MLLKNCTILIDGKETQSDILIEGAKISKIGKDIPYYGNTIDLSGKHVIPGLIDPHVHFRDPGMTQKEDFFTGSKAAAAGGITTVLDMPNTIPPTTTVDLLKEKRKLAEKSIVNYGFHFGAASDNISEIKKAKNIASVKVFLNVTTGKLLIEDDNVLEEVFKAAGTISVHAEGDMVRKAVELAKKTKTRLYLCHISTKEEVDYLKKNKGEGIFAEVTPHHLFLTEDDDKDSFTKMKPELKSEHDQKALWEAVKDGIIDTIGTDHAPHTIEEKKKMEFPHGVPGCETILPLLLDQVNKGKIKLSKVVELACENPAKIFSIKNKGHIMEGYDADLTVVDMDLVKEVQNEKLYTKCGWSPFHGRKLKGWPVMTIVNGNIVYGEGKLNEEVKGREVEIDGKV